MMKSIAILLLVSCWDTLILPDPLDKIYRNSTLSWDLREILAHDTPDSSAYKGITQYLLVMAFSEEQLVGKTYREILDLSRLWTMKQEIRDQQEKTLAKQTDLEQERRYESLRKIVAVILDGKEVISLDSALSITYHFTLTNHSNKSIKSVEGYVEINEALSSYFMRLDLTFAKPMPGHSSRREKVSFKKSKELGQTPKDSGEPGKLIWRPEKILFEDGSIPE